MKFLSWFGGKKDQKSNTSTTTYDRKEEHREEFNDWPHSLLAIGTFGNSNNEIKENPSQNYHNNHHSDENIQEGSSTEEITDHFTNEEIVKLQKELTKLLRKKPTNNVEKENAELPLDRFLNCPSSLEVDRRISNNNNNSEEVGKEDDDDDENIDEKTLSMILGKCKEICNKKKSSLGKKSFSFLLKKMFVCRSGFAPIPSLRDTLQESRMEKLLRTILHKKIYSQQQNSSQLSSMNKCLQNMKMKDEEANDGCKWVKTDSEYIVLEI